MADYVSNPDGKGPAGGWGSLKSIARIYGESWPTPAVLETLARQAAETEQGKPTI
ncbi:hypothetical protein J2T09_004844 [Neorhizobium huautlense]|uniref:Uncharacterized protein n=1 Tax=Neorhizobium huautlense TaxID=67774 RepID=A0ABT9Q1S0_9HYPH|nr:hypothetical protein [Neorhizobium huautlense]MDP9840064.1 hypothetical protein [Neorhizobium huautlense]